jgi:predicted dehydrogenase
VEGTSGLARGTIGWPEYPARVPSTLDFSTTRQPNCWFQPRWSETWFPDAFVGPMAQLLVALETNTEPEISGQDNLRTMALVEACYRSSEERRVVAMSEFRLR